MNTVSTPQRWALGLTATAFTAVGVAGAVSTYRNLLSTLGSTSEAASVVLAGEGAVLVASLVCISLAMLGQAAPAVARFALWMLPLIGSGAGAYLADSPKERVVYALSPLAMATAAEGLNLVARRVVTYRVGRDVNADARNASLVAAITYHQGRSERHPDAWAKWYSQRRVWQLAGKLTVTDPALVAHLTTTQSERLTAGADVALASLLGGTVAGVAVAATPATPELAAVAPEPSSEVVVVAPPRNGMGSATRGPVAPPEPLPPIPAPAAPADGDVAELEAAVAEAVAEVAETIHEDDSIELLTTKQVAERCGVEPVSVRTWVSRGQLPVHAKDAQNRNLFHPLDVAQMKVKGR